MNLGGDEVQLSKFLASHGICDFSAAFEKLYTQPTIEAVSALNTLLPAPLRDIVVSYIDWIKQNFAQAVFSPACEGWGIMFSCGELWAGRSDKMFIITLSELDRPYDLAYRAIPEPQHVVARKRVNDRFIKVIRQRLTEFCKYTDCVADLCDGD